MTGGSVVAEAQGVRIDWDAVPWQVIGEGARARVVADGGQRVRMLEFAAGFEEPDWCCKGHIFYVLEGAFDLRSRDGLEHYREGDSGFLRAGEAHAHKVVCSAHEGARLLVFEVESQGGYE